MQETKEAPKEMINNESKINRDPEEDHNMEKAQGRATDHREETTETGGVGAGSTCL